MTGHTKNYFKALKQSLSNLNLEQIEKFKKTLIETMSSGQTIFICGNGGSAATASHMTCDLGKTILGKKPRTKKNRARVISLNDNIPFMTAWGNDEGYKHIFSEQLRNLGVRGDLLVVITGSGNSDNILQAIKTAKSMGISVFGLLGFQGGIAREKISDYILVESDNYGIVEDVHGIINHLVTDYFKTLRVG